VINHRLKRHAVALAGVVLLVSPSVAVAQLALPSPLPAGLIPTAAANLNQIHDGLVATHDRLEGEISKQNGECSDVRSDDQDRVAACGGSQQRIRTELSDYKAALARYEQALKNLPPQGVSPAQIEIGTSADVSDTYMIGADGKQHPFKPGDPLVLNARVLTGPSGHAQFLLLDQTVFTLGPNSDMVMDDFVYDPNTNGGKMTASLTKGVFRFVSGRLAHDDVRERVPSGSLGPRGTEYEVFVAADDSVRLKDFKGEIYFMPNSGGPEVFLKAGQMVQIDAHGNAGITEPIR